MSEPCRDPASVMKVLVVVLSAVQSRLPCKQAAVSDHRMG